MSGVVGKMEFALKVVGEEKRQKLELNPLLRNMVENAKEARPRKKSVMNNIVQVL